MTVTLILVESMKVLSNQSFAAKASFSVLYPTNPNRRDVPSGLSATLESVKVPPGPSFCSKCSRKCTGVTYEGKFLIMRRDIGLKIARLKSAFVIDELDKQIQASIHIPAQPPEILAQC